jgi:hypothetical protein
MAPTAQTDKTTSAPKAIAVCQQKILECWVMD